MINGEIKCDVMASHVFDGFEVRLYAHDAKTGETLVLREAIPYKRQVGERDARIAAVREEFAAALLDPDKHGPLPGYTQHKDTGARRAGAFCLNLPRAAP